MERILKQAIEAQRNGALEDARRLYQRILEVDPENQTAISNLAIIAAQLRNFGEAERLFRQAVKVRPNVPAVFSNLGLFLQQQGRLDEAIAAHRRAIELKYDYPAAHFNLGNSLKERGELAEAVAAYQRAIKLKPDYAEAYNNLGVVLQHQGKFDDALATYGEVIKLHPTYAEAHFNRAVVMQNQGKFEDAVAAYHQVIKIRPDNPDAYNNLGSALQEQGKLDDALAACEQALKLNSNFAQAHFNCGTILQQQGRFDEALAAYSQAIKLNPTYVEAINNLVIVLQELGRFDEAIEASAQVLRINPTYIEAQNNLGIALLAQGKIDEALKSFQRALAIKPDYPDALYNLGNAWRERGNLEEAITAYSEALQLQPDNVQAFSQLIYHRWRACDWTDFESDQEKLLEIVRNGTKQVPPFYLLATEANSSDQLICARRWAESIKPHNGNAFQHVPSRQPHRIRIGYLSGDFHQHATAYLMAELFECHDRKQFEVFAYSYGADDQTPMRTRLSRAFDQFVDIGPLSHRKAAERIHEDKIELLIDLKGYTHHARPMIVGYRPAPIQVNYLGFPGTMGADFVDYILVDRFVVPTKQQRFYSEKLVHLPGCYQVNDTKREITASTNSRIDCGLPRDGFVFCCFNNSYKINPMLFGIWTQLLKALPESVLWLLEPNDLVKRNLRREAESRGVDPERLVFAPLVPLSEHLGRHMLADLFLDTLPCNAHTTASDAIWAGLPVLTCAGETFASRVAASLLKSIELPELITSSLEAYETLALDLARHPRRLIEMRNELKKKRDMGILFDTARMTKNIEAAYIRMWETWRAGEKPVAFAVEEP